MSVEVRCVAEGDGYRCAVTVSDGRSTEHSVWVRRADLERWGRGRTAEELVADSFAFLLGRESKESILRDFDLAIIKHYFPDYDG